MRNQFFYTVVQEDEKAAPVIGSFNTQKVVRTMEYKPGCLMCLLDDLHQESKRVPQPAGKNGKVTLVNQMMSVASEIYLTEEDSIRYRAVTEQVVPQ